MAVGDFPEGATATHKDGRKIVFRNGEWRVLQGASPSKEAQESERTAGFLATRLAGGVAKLKEVGGGDSPSLWAEFVRSAAGDTAANYATGTDRQRVEAAQADMLDAALTLGTGAAYNPEQLKGYTKAYFPQLGDSAGTITDKRQRLNLLLQAARLKAGSASGQIDAALKAAGITIYDEQAKGGDPASGVPGAATDESGAPPTPPGEVKFLDELPQESANAKPLTDEQRSALQAVAQSGGSADQIMALGRSFGVNITADNAGALAKFYADPKNRNVVPVVNEDNTVKPVDAGDGAMGAAARGAGNALTLGFLDEAGALADTVTQGGTYNDNLDRRRGQELYDEQNHSWFRLTGQLVGGLPVGGIEFMSAKAASRAAGVAAMRANMGTEAAQAIANRVYAARTAAEAAGIGGVYGFGDAQGGLGERAVGAGIGAAVGGAAGGALALAGGRFARTLASRGGGPRPPSGGQEVLAAAERQNIVPFPADVGGAATRRATSAAAQTIGGAGPIVRGAQATVESAQAVRDRVAAGLGKAVGLEETGEVARRGIDAYRARTSAVVGRIYDAAEAAGGQTRIATPEALRVLNQELTALEESPVQGAGVGILQGLRDQLQGDVTVRGLRNARTLLREEFENNGLRRSNTERIAGRVLDAANDDIVAGLRAQGQDRAANLYQRADRMWRERLANIDENLTPILGDADGPRAKSGEQVVQALKQAMSGNNRRFVGFLNSLPSEERGIVRASLVSRMGQATKGQQDETGEVFSLSTFLTNWNDIGNRAKTALFGEEGRAALNDLARYAAGSREAQRYANFSNTGGAIGNLATGATLSAGPLALVSTLIAQYGAGRLLSSPSFARWLARPPRNITPASTQAYVARLTRIARAEPAIANDVLALQQRLSDAFGGSVTRLAADERHDRADIVDGQQGQPAGPQQRLQP